MLVNNEKKKKKKKSKFHILLFSPTFDMSYLNVCSVQKMQKAFVLQFVLSYVKISLVCLDYITTEKLLNNKTILTLNWTASSEFGTYSLCEQRRFRRACASAQSRQNLRC